MINNRVRLLLLSGVMAVAACGGGVGDSPPAPRPSHRPRAPRRGAENSLAVVVDRGPAELNRAGVAAVNTAFASVTLCTPGTGGVPDHRPCRR